MGDEDFVDYGNYIQDPGLENYECDGCRADGFTASSSGCHVCPYNEERIREYKRKYS